MTTRQKRDPTTFVLAALVAVATGLACYRLGTKSLWRDEGLSAQIARSSFSDFWAVVREGEVNGSTHLFALFLWVRLGASETVLRLLSAIAFVASVPVQFRTAEKLFDRRAAVLSAGMLAVSAYALRYAQEARQYAMVLFLVTLATLLFIRAVERPNTGRWVAYAVVAVLGLYGHFYFAFVVGAQLASLLLLPRGTVPRTRVLQAAGLAAIGLVVQLVWLVTLNENEHAIDWIDRPGIRDLWVTAVALGGNGNRVLAVAICGLATLGIALGVRTALRVGRAWGTWRAGLAVLSLILPIALAVLISVVKPILETRYLIVCLPALMTLAGFALSRLSGAVLVIGIAVLVALSAASIHEWYWNQPKEDFRSATGYMVERWRSDDGIVIMTAPDLFPFEYYAEEFDDRGSPIDGLLLTKKGEPVFSRALGPRGLDLAKSSLDDADSLEGGLDVIAHHERVWILGEEGSSEDQHRVEQQLSDRFDRVSTRLFHEVRVVLLQRS